MADDELPTIGDLVSNWLGVQLPTIPLPQTLRNIDKAIGKIVLAGGENVEARIKASTTKAKARTKIEVDGMFRTEDEERKFENRTASMKAALEEIGAGPAAADAASEIEDDWLNLFARLSEDKSSEELQQLFGKILSGEIRRPGSFSLRTLQVMSTLTKGDAETLSRLLSYVINGVVLPFETGESGSPSTAERLFLVELTIGSHPSQIGGMKYDFSIPPGSHILAASGRGLLIQNQTSAAVAISIAGQILSQAGKELIKIANPPLTDLEFLKKIATQIKSDLRSNCATEVGGGLLQVHVVAITPTERGQFRDSVIHTTA